MLEGQEEQKEEGSVTREREAAVLPDLGRKHVHSLLKRSQRAQASPPMLLKLPELPLLLVYG